MEKISFRYLREEERISVLPQLFQILSTNMSKIAPSDGTPEEDKKAWLSYIVQALDSGETKILLMYAGDALAGYFQYSIDGDTLQVDEVELKPEYQRTFAFYRLCQHLCREMPKNIRYLTSYVNVGNHNSIAIHEKLGMKRIGTNKSGTSWHYCGEAARAAEKFQGRKR